MPASLFIDRHSNGLAFYINGDLQFDTSDEAIYHEYLVVPAISLAVKRFPETPLRVLICGGGDGLAARDVLRFPEVGEITLVDYSAEVLELGRTVFEPYNQGSLVEEADTALGESRITVHTQEAFEFVSRLPDACYHIVICDFTFPTCPEETGIYSLEWFQQVQRVLCAGGVMSTNGVSPEQRSLGFWCLYQTLLAAEIQVKPMQVEIPSFQRHGYGDWGFFLGSNQAIARPELESLPLPANLQVLHGNSWLKVFSIQTAIARLRDTVCIHTQECPQLFYYLLNPEVSPATETNTDLEESWTDFLDIQEAGTRQHGTLDLLQLDAMAQVWLDRLKHSVDTPDPSELTQLIPVQHRYQTPKMTREWIGYLRSLLQEIDMSRLMASLLERSQELPPKLVQELRQLVEKIKSGQPLTYISEHTAELITILTVTLLMANLTAPDSVFAKGFFGGGSSSYRSGSGSSSSSCYYDADGDYQCGGRFGWFGFWMMVIGGVWLANITRNRNSNE